MNGNAQAERLETVLLVPSAEMPRTSSEKTTADQIELGVLENPATPAKAQMGDGNFYLRRTLGYTGSNDSTIKHWAVEDGSASVESLMYAAESLNGEKFLATEFVNMAFKYPRTASKHKEVYGFGARHVIPKDGDILYVQAWEIASAWDPCEENCEDAAQAKESDLNHVCFTREEAEVDPVDYVNMLASETMGRPEYDVFQKAKASWFRIHKMTPNTQGASDE
jgi:hypothetical protein